MVREGAIRGGKRLGSGRKPIPDSEKKRNITFSLPQDVIRWIREQENQSETVERAIRAMMNKE